MVMKRISFLREMAARLAIHGLCLGSGFNLWAEAPVEDYRFKVEVLAAGMAQPLELELAPDGRIFFQRTQGGAQNLEAGNEDGS